MSLFGYMKRHFISKNPLEYNLNANYQILITIKIYNYDTRKSKQPDDQNI